MYPFILVPKNELEQLSVHLHETVTNWLSAWSCVQDSNIKLDIDNAYMLDESSLEYEEHIYHEHNVYILKTKSTQKLFYNLLCYSVLKNADDDSAHAHGEIFEYLLTETIDDLLEITFGGAKIRTEKGDVIGYTELLKKGSGAIYIKLSIGKDYTVLIIPRYVYEHLLPKKQSIEKSRELHDINFDNINTAKELSLNVLFNPTVLNIHDLISLAEGDCLVLDHRTNEKLNLYVNDELFTTGRLGKNDQYKAISLDT